MEQSGSHRTDDPSLTENAAKSPKSGMSPLSHHSPQIDLSQLETLLDELADLAVRGGDDEPFYQNILSHLQSLFPARGAWLLRQATNGQWWAAHGLPSTTLPAPLAEWAVAGPFHDGLQCRSEAAQFACSFPARGSSTNILVVTAAEDDADARHFRRQLLEALAEICQDFERDQTIRNLGKAALPVEDALRITNDLLKADNYLEACHILANDGCTVLGCDRLSVFEVRKRRLKPRAITGSDEFDQHAPLIKSLASIADLAVVRGQAIVVADLDNVDDEQFASLRDVYRQHSDFQQLIAFPLRNASANSGVDEPFAVVVMENRESTMQQNSHHWRETLPVVERVLGQRYQDDTIPGVVRRLFYGLHQFRSQLRRGTVVRFAILGILLLAGSWFLSRPIPVMIEADGQLKPVAQRHVFAPADGRVADIRIGDRAEVTRGQVLLVLDSPSLTLQLSEIDGRIATLNNKRDTLTIAVSQTATNAREQVLQTKIAAEIAEIDEELLGLGEQRKIVESEMTRLTVKSPLDGQVVSWNFAQSLQERPVRRGDSLLQIANGRRGWRLEIHVPDGESGHVREAFARGDDVQVDYVILSQPQETRSARLTDVSTAVQMTSRGGVAVPVFAEIPQKGAPSEMLADSAVRARIHCGEKSRGYVWFRKIIESLHRRFWL